MSTKVLVVDDSEMDRFLAGRLLERGYGPHLPTANGTLAPLYATGGEEALEILRREGPEIVVSDLMMEWMSGLDLVRKIRQEAPAVPVILMTAHGSEEVAYQALQQGAAGYVPKKYLARDLLETVRNVLELTRARRDRQRIAHRLHQLDAHFVLETDPSLVAPLVAQLGEMLVQVELCDANEQIRVGIALRESVINAIHHGNLEVASELQQQDPAAYTALIDQRLREPPYRDRRVHVVVQFKRGEALFRVRNEGRGFDHSALLDPADSSRMTRPRGRGLLLIYTFMDHVSFNKTGTEITMIKRRR
jgi:CheY-like chemotaxis protein/anti-sigma regulatory factor (Ser/Thr protein kinase)